MDHDTIYTPPRGAVWAAGAFSYWLDRLADLFHSSGLEEAQTPDDVRRFARQIQHAQPSFAADLYAAADRADNERA